jgi:hypothetical protein
MQSLADFKTDTKYIISFDLISIQIGFHLRVELISFSIAFFSKLGLE